MLIFLMVFFLSSVSFFSSAGCHKMWSCSMQVSASRNFCIQQLPQILCMTFAY